MADTQRDEGLDTDEAIWFAEQQGSETRGIDRVVNWGFKIIILGFAAVVVFA